MGGGVHGVLRLGVGGEWMVWMRFWGCDWCRDEREVAGEACQEGED